MRPRKKTILLSAAAVALAIGIVVACSNDDTDNSTKAIHTNVSPKTVANTSQTSRAFLDFWDAYSIVRRTAPSELRAACLSNDYEAFFSLTGISEMMISDALMQIESQMREYASARTESRSDEIEDCHCSTNSLATLYDAVEDIYRAYEEQGIANPEIMRGGPGMSEELYACLQNCISNYNQMPDSLYVCQQICYILEKFREVTTEDPGLIEEPTFP